MGVIIYARTQAAEQAESSQRHSAELDASRSAGAVSRIRGHDPGFDAAGFCGRVEAGFLKLQQAWSAQDLSALRPFISDGVHERFSLQFAEQKAEGYHNVMQGVTIAKVSIADAASDDIYDEVAVRIRARALDCRVSLTDGRQIAESRPRMKPDANGSVSSSGSRARKRVKSGSEIFAGSG